MTDPLLASALDLAAGALAPSTRAVYEATWREFESFAATRGLPSLPTDRATLGRWLAFRAAAGRGSGARGALSAVRAAHVERGYPDPVADGWLHRVAAGAERVAAATRPPREQRAPLPVEVVRHVLSTVPAWLGVAGARSAGRDVPEAAVIALRDAALIALGLRLIRRVSELLALRVADVVFEPHGMVATIRRSKTDQLGVGLRLPVDAVGSETCPVGLLRRWLAVRPLLVSRGRGTDALFVSATGRPLSSSAVSSLVARAAASAGLTGRFSSHSLRIGGATAAVHGGASMAVVKAVGGWSSDTVRRYARPSAVRLSASMGF